MTTPISKFVLNTDYQLLSDQKSALLGNLGGLEPIPNDILDGLINFLDSFVDAAVESGLVSEEKAFKSVTIAMYDDEARVKCHSQGITSEHIIDICASVMMTRDGVLQGGGFVQAIIDNDLAAAAARADAECRQHLHLFVMAKENWKMSGPFIYNGEEE